MTAGEAEMLLFALERSRAQFAWKCGGLDAAGLHKVHPPSTMTLGGLVKHDRGWRSEARVIEGKYGQGILATKTLLDLTHPTWAVPAPLAALLLA